MNSRLLSFTFVALQFSALHCVHNYGRNIMRIRERVERSRLRLADFYSIASAPPEQWLEQPLDHFDGLNPETYMQRYWVNDEFWQKSGPVFLYIGGEGGLTVNTVLNGEHVDLARKFGALIVSAEHRFYGKSIRKDGLERANLKYLSSQQALSDLSTLHALISHKLKLRDDHPWVCFGGSYPGALSAWFRVKFPHLVTAAVASSAPLQAKLDFVGYNDVVRGSLADTVVNGSQECSDNVKAAFRQIDEFLERSELAKLEADFVSCEPLAGDADVSQFVSNLADIFMGTVQYNEEVPGLDITKICQHMTSGESPYSNLQNLTLVYLKSMAQKCNDNSYQKYVKQLMNTTVEAVSGGVGERQWLYQTCSQFGYYQTCESNSSCPFSRRMTLKSNTQLCADLFGIDAAGIARRIQFTNDYYGGRDPKGTRIIFINGSVDPWHALSVLHDLSGSELSLFIHGTAHCANMNSQRPTDSKALRAARQDVLNQLSFWLDGI